MLKLIMLTQAHLFELQKYGMTGYSDSFLASPSPKVFPSLDRSRNSRYSSLEGRNVVAQAALACLETEFRIFPTLPLSGRQEL